MQTIICIVSEENRDQQRCYMGGIKPPVSSILMQALQDKALEQLRVNSTTKRETILDEQTAPSHTCRSQDTSRSRLAAYI